MAYIRFDSYIQLARSGTQCGSFPVIASGYMFLFKLYTGELDVVIRGDEKPQGVS